MATIPVVNIYEVIDSTSVHKHNHFKIAGLVTISIWNKS